tara:strand:+ start:442 stop:1953 length:1512 start_codon:yes stop_codon:yes gene_type:complete
MKVRDHRQMMRSLTDPLNIPKLRALVEANPVLTQEEFRARQNMAEGGVPQLVQPGPGRPGYQGKEHHLKGKEPWNKGKTYKLQHESWKGNIEIPKGKVTVAELIDLVGSERLNIDTFAQGRKQEKPSYVYNKIAKLLNEKKIDYRKGKTGLYYLYDKPSKAQIKEIQTFIDSPLLAENTVKTMQIFNKAFADNFTGKGKEFPTLDEARAVLEKKGVQATDAQMARAMMRLGQAYQGNVFRNEVPIQVNRIGGNFITKSFNEMDQFHPWRSATYDAALDDIGKNMPKGAGDLRSFKNTYTEYMRNNFPEYKGFDLNEVFSVTTSANKKSYPYAYFVDLTKSAINKKQLSGFQGKASLAEGKIIDNIKKYRKTGDVKYYNEALRVKNIFNNKTRKNFLSSEKIKKAGGVNALQLELGTKYQILNKSNIAKDFYAKNTLNKWKDLGIDIAGHSADAGYIKLGATKKGTIPIQELFTPESRLKGKKVMVASTLNKFLEANGVDICNV